MTNDGAMLFWWCLATAGLTQVVTQSSLFRPLRQFIHDRLFHLFYGKVVAKYSDLGAAARDLIVEDVVSRTVEFWMSPVACAMCLGAWVGAGMGLLLGTFPVLTTFGVLWLDTVLGVALAGFAGSAVSFLWVFVSRLVYLSVLDKED